MSESLAAVLAPILASLPDEASVTLPVGWLRAHVGGSEVTRREVGDLSVADVAGELDRAPATVRGWCARGAIPGAYRLHGREWRIPRASIRRYLDGQAEGAPVQPSGSGPVDLGAWRRHYPVARSATP